MSESKHTPVAASDEDKANAHLIAAAPDLLEALIGVCRSLEDHVKAEGSEK